MAISQISNSRPRHMRRKATMMGLMSKCSNCRPDAVTVPSFRALVCGYVAMAVLRTVVLVAVAIVDPPIGIPEGTQSRHLRSVCVYPASAAADAGTHLSLRWPLKREWQLIELHHILHRHLVALFGCTVLQNLVQDLLGMREDRVAVWIVTA